MVDLQAQPRITSLLLSENELSSFANFKGHNAIMKLDLRKNKLKDCKGIVHMALLQELLLNENELTSLADLTDLPCLHTLSVNTNKLESLSTLPMINSLKKLDIGANPIPGDKIGEIKQLAGLKCLEHVVFAGCFEGKEDDIKKEVLMQLDNLKIKKVNDEEVTPEDVQAAAEEKAERARLAKEAEEEAARLAAEKAAAGEQPEGEVKEEAEDN